MARRNVTLKTISNQRNNTTPRRRTVFVGGQEVANEKTVVKAAAMVNKLVSNKIIPPPSREQMGDLKQFSNLALFGVNITIRDDIGSDYSLLEQQKKNNLLENTNIVNPSLKNLSNELQDPQKDKFVNKEDPFFELDDEPASFMREQEVVLKKQTAKDVTKIAADIFDQNNPFKHGNTKNLKQFPK